MTTTLKSLIDANAFTGYEIKPADWRLSPDHIEAAIYGQDATQDLSYDLIETFTGTFKAELITINTWTCTDTEVGLEVLRMEGRPVGLVWQSARKSDRHVVFLDEAAMTAVRKAWDSIKTSPEADAWFVDPAILDMPVAAPGEKGFDLESAGRILPTLSSTGAAQWIVAEGGVAAITNVAALRHCVMALAREIENDLAFFADVEGKELLPEIAAAFADDLAKLKSAHTARASLRDQIQDRILQLS